MEPESIIPVIDPPPLEEEAEFTTESRYRLERLLGEGGMGEVWLADRYSAGGHSRPVAIKYLSRPGSSVSLKAEALRMSHLQHDNIVPFVDSGRDNHGRYFVAMSYVEGMDLDGLRKLAGMEAESVYAGRATRRIPDPISGFILFMVLRALHHAHHHDFGDGVIGLVHRDVSPGNILIDEARGFVKLTDFGVAIACTNEAADEIGRASCRERV
jgi:eukaryotic-like serine/threonine-protein kinase